MVRLPSFFISISSTNLAPDMPVMYEIHLTTHHWRGELLDSWAAVNMEYSDIYQTPDALDFIKKEFLALQLTESPSQDHRLVFPEQAVQSYALLDDDKEYYDAVALTTSKGWAWEENYQEVISTGEKGRRVGGHPIRLTTWEWAGHRLGVSVQFVHRQRHDESKAEVLLRMLETAEKAKEDFTDSIPHQTLTEVVRTDVFHTNVIFNRTYN